MRLGICFDGMRPVGEMVELARAAEASWKSTNRSAG
jgi:hypothetical protein